MLEIIKNNLSLIGFIVAILLIIIAKRIEKDVIYNKVAVPIYLLVIMIFMGIWSGLFNKALMLF